MTDPLNSASQFSNSHQSTSIDFAPPSLYTPYYCEENVYLLVEALRSTPGVLATWACFISNEDRRAILFNQKASRQPQHQGSYVIWDYHVVAIARIQEGEKERVVVVDRDSKLGEVVDLSEYVERTFYPSLFQQDILDPSLASRFRIIPGLSFLENFTSDRSHMLRVVYDEAAEPIAANGVKELAFEYVHPPPPYPPICGSTAQDRGEKHNLWTHFLDVSLDGGESTRFGTVLATSTELLQYNFRGSV